jgi:predicted GNAT superfamily acetyltransferase
VAGSEAQVAPIEIRQLFDREEFEDVVALQKTIWSFADAELLPLRFLVVVSNVGGHVFGAYDGPRMIGFCFAIPGIKPDGRPYLHSHMLGVLPEYRNAQIGRRLKLHQRDDALARGIALIEWTFDPLELKNAYLNIEKLGAIVRVYKENQYGTTSSPLHGGLPTDRCIAEWWLDSPRVHSILVGQALSPASPILDPALAGGVPSGSACPTGRIAYPIDIDAIRRQDTARARAIQQANARLFLDAFERGLAVTGFERTAAEGTYLLEPCNETRPRHPAPDPHAAGALLRDQLFPHL